MGRALFTVILITCVFFVNFISRIVLGPLAPIVEEDLNITHGQTGSLFFMISVGYCVSLFLSGFVSSRISHRATIWVSALGVAVSLTFSAFSWALDSLRLGFLLVGMAAGLYLPSGMSTITSLVERTSWGKAIAIHELAPNLGFVIAPFMVSSLCRAVGWRGILALLAVASLVGAACFLRWGKGGEFKGVAPSLSSMRVLARERGFWLMMGIFGMGVGGSLGVYAMLPLFLVTTGGWELDKANSLVGLSRVISSAMAFVGGWASDRIGAARTISTALIFSGLATILISITEGPLLTLAIFLQPAFAVCFFPAALATVSRLGPPEMRNLAISLVVPTGFLVGAGMIPALVGRAADMGEFPLGLAAVGLATIVSGIVTKWLKTT